MKLEKVCFVMVIGLMVDMLSLHGMQTILRSRKAVEAAALRTGRSLPTIQQRSLYDPGRVKGLYTPLTPEARKVSPVFGAIEYETKALHNRYEVQSEAPGPQLVKQLFFQLESQFRPTVKKSNAAYSLTSGILGLVLGALVTGKLQDKGVRDYIIGEWRDEHKRITGDKISLSKVDALLKLIEQAYENDHDDACRILLGFLYAKASPDNDHDMMHYLVGLSNFMEIFADQNSQIAKSIKQFSGQKKDISQGRESFFDQVKSAGQSFKNYVMGSYESSDFSHARAELSNVIPAEAVRKALTESFEVTVASILDEQRGSLLYPPQIIMAKYGYKGKQEANNCVETAIRDLFNIMLYRPESQSFDVSLLPTTLSLNDKFKEFYINYSSVSKIHTKECAQAFMDLVSGIEGVVYNKGDYELAGAEGGKNFLTLCNYFFNSNAQGLNDLGAMLSDEQRILTFDIKKAEFLFPSKISMTIKNKKTNQELHAGFYFRPGHAWTQVPKRNKKEIIQQLPGEVGKSFLDPEELVEHYSISKEARALFAIQPAIQSFVLQQKNQISPSSYYTLSTETDEEKRNVIKNILKNSMKNKEARDYATHLYLQTIGRE